MKKISIRKFKTGAVRNPDKEKLDYEGFLSPQVLERFAKHMRIHARQEDGNYRPSDNWQKGIPQEIYIKSLLRHVIDLWKQHRGCRACRWENGHLVDKEDLCCAIMFNSMGYLFEEIKKKEVRKWKPKLKRKA